ncbi:MAG: DUF4198 domain-containing protein [Planctomycetaceae bacterium]|jgi:hypothetical protein|nr:DUF4198 domain-containing protein [Planctomycetaceae bacterium]
MKTFTIITLFFVTITLSGCGSSSTNIAGLVPAAGTVTLNGQPLADAGITFVPTELSRRAAGAKTDAAGKFTVSTLNPSDGIAPGEYRVVISKQDEKPAATLRQTKTEIKTPSGKVLPDPHKNRRLFKDGKPIPAGSVAETVRTETLGKYAQADTSGLTVTIPPKGDKQLTLTLTLP